MSDKTVATEQIDRAAQALSVAIESALLDRMPEQQARDWYLRRIQETVEWVKREVNA